MAFGSLITLTMLSVLWLDLCFIKIYLPLFVSIKRDFVVLEICWVSTETVRVKGGPDNISLNSASSLHVPHKYKLSYSAKIKQRGPPWWRSG